MYNVFGEKVNDFIFTMVAFTIHIFCSLTLTIVQEDGQRIEVQECHIWGTGVVILTRRNQLFAVHDLSDSPVQPMRLADPGCCVFHSIVQN